MTGLVTVLSGGVGGAKLVAGLAAETRAGSLTVVANTGDDFRHLGLHISPDCDILIYTLAGRVNAATGWGVRDDSFHALEAAAALGAPGWFRLGDRDLGVHLFRTHLLAHGVGLAEVTRRIAAGFGVDAAILPMTEAEVPTRLETSRGDLHLQEYLARERCEPAVRAIRWPGIERARPAPGVVAALEGAERVVLAPSNPLISIGPILAVPGVRERLAACRGPRIAVSPIVGGRALKGPTAGMMAELGHEVSPLGVARLYRGLVDVLVVDERDAAWRPEIEALGMQCRAMPAVMRSEADRRLLARRVLAVAGE